MIIISNRVMGKGEQRAQDSMEKVEGREKRKV
jgi:hypothetical protein